MLYDWQIGDQLGDLTPWQTAPDFWLSTPATAAAFIAGLREAEIGAIGTSAGGRPITAIAYGDKEPVGAAMDNLASALAATTVPPDPTNIFPATFYGTQRRRKPVLVLQGAVHGGEITGTVASLNLCQIIETGADLRGKAWPRLHDLARQTRVVIIPWLNMDGAARCPVVHCCGMSSAMNQALTQGIMKDGTHLQYPAVKKLHPMPLAELAFLGTYYNDAGVNLHYDFAAVTRQPETTAWMTHYLAERPDGVIAWHCNAGTLFGPPGYFLPQGYQFEMTRLAGWVRSRLVREGYGHPVAGRLSWAALPGMNRPVIDQIDAIFHTCGALPMLCELPIGCQEFYCSFDDLLDIGLLVIEETLAFAHSEGLRPFEFQEKVRRQFDH